MSSKKPAKKTSSKPPAKKPTSSVTKERKLLSDKIITSNYFNNDKKRLPRKKNLNRQKPKQQSWWHTFKQKLKQLADNRHQRKQRNQARKRNQESVPLTNQTPKASQARRSKLHPLTWLKFIFSFRGFKLGLKIVLVLFILGAVLLSGLYLHYRQDVPQNINALQNCISGQTTKYYDSSGTVLLWASKSDIDCQPIQLGDVSPHLINALLTSEDQDFYEHQGFQTSAIVRALFNNLFDRESSVQGGSTLTQQYIKNAILQDSSRNFSRKIRELIVAIELERKFNKDEILVAYLNTISFGSIYNGVEAASLGYFDKPSAELTIDEAALLVAALPAPTVYWGDPDLHRNRQHFILSQMLQDQMISQEEYEQAIETDTFAKIISSHKQYEDITAPHFILEAEKRLTAELCQLEQAENPEENCDNIRLRGYTVITTLDVNTQELAEQTIAEVIPTITDKGFDNAAAVAVEVKTGKVLALVGSRDFEYPGFGQTNTASQQRDPGSTFKIFDYGALIDSNPNWGPGSVFYDYSTVFDNRDWAPTNYNGRHAGPITMRHALGQSLNIPAVKAMYIAGIDNVHQFAYKAGIRTKLPCSGGCGLASAFGGGSEVRLDELTNAYATFSREGNYLPLTYIDKVLDAEGNILQQWRERPERVFKHETAYLMNHMLADQSVRYTDAFNLDPSVATTMAVKTGTDDNFVNNHIVGYSKTVAFGGWMGNHSESVTFETERFTTPPKALMIKRFMEAYHRNLPHEQRNHWRKPAGIKTVRLDSLTGYHLEDGQIPAGQRFHNIDLTSHSDIFPSWYVTQIAPEIPEDETTIAIDLVSYKIATLCTPLEAMTTLPAVAINEEVKIDDPFYDNWQTAISSGFIENFEVTNLHRGFDDSHQCSDRRPDIRLLQQPISCSEVCNLEIEVRRGTFELTKVLIYHNHQLLVDGEIEVDGDRQTINYQYRPFDQTSDSSFRGHLRLEVQDEGLYSDSIDVLLNITGFPNPQIPDPPETSILQLLDATLNDSGQLIINWSKPQRGLSLHLNGDCENLATIPLPPAATSATIDIDNYPAGDCVIYISTDDNQTSNRLTIHIETQEASP